MSLQTIANSLFAVILPAALLCYFPMTAQMKRGVIQTLVLIGSTLSATILASTWLTRRLELMEYDLLIPLLIICFLAFHFSLNAPLIKTVTVFSVVIALMSILANYAAYLGGFSEPRLGMGYYPINVSLIQIGLNSPAALLLAGPFLKYGKLIISQPSDSKGWHAVTLFSDAILIISLALRPIEYGLFEEPKVSREGINLPRRFD